MFVYASLQSMVSLSCKLLVGYQTFTLQSTGKPPSHQAHSTVELTPLGSWESSELGESNIARELWLRPRRFPGMKTRCRLACRPCDWSSRKLNKTGLTEKFRGVYLPIGWVFTGYLSDCWESYQCHESVWLCDFRMVLTRRWSRGWIISPKYFVQP